MTGPHDSRYTAHGLGQGRGDMPTDALPVETWTDRAGQTRSARAIVTAAHAEAVAGEIAEHAADWGGQCIEGGRVDWEAWADRFEAAGFLLPADWHDPAMRRVQRIARAAMAEAGLFDG